MNREIELNRLALYRKQHFAVEVKPTRDPIMQGEISLSVTYNGRQWQTISLAPEEVEKVVAALSTPEVW